MPYKNNHITYDTDYYKALYATNEELIRMYIKGTNRYAVREMKQRGIY